MHPEGVLTLSAPTVMTGHRVLDDAWVQIADGRIADLGQGAPPTGTAVHLEGTLIPGMVDIHCHGGAGAAFTDGPDAARQVAAAHLAHGTTSLMASLVTDTIDRLAHQIAQLAPLVAAGELIGVHLEGPWISEQYHGAHDVDRLIEPTLKDARRLLDDAGTVRMVTLAPELAGTSQVIAELRRRQVTVALGHTAATAAQTTAALAAGAGVMTHLFNAMRPVHHREPGPVWAAARSDAFLELIADGIHLHPVVLGDVLRQFGSRAVLVTDAMAAAAAADGHYRLGPMAVTVVDGRATIRGTEQIAGSSLTMDAALRYAVTEADVPLEAAVRAATANPAAALGLSDRGVLHPGARADLVLLDEDLHVVKVMQSGEWR